MKGGEIKNVLQFTQTGGHGFGWHGARRKSGRVAGVESTQPRGKPDLGAAPAYSMRYWMGSKPAASSRVKSCSNLDVLNQTVALTDLSTPSAPASISLHERSGSKASYTNEFNPFSFLAV